jgi:hypothetical protein
LDISATKSTYNWEFAIVVLKSKILYRKTIKTNKGNPFPNEISHFTQKIL